MISGAICPESSRAAYGGGMFRTLRRYQVIADAAFAAAFLLLQLASLSSVGNVLPSLVVALIFATALALRRLSPALALAGAWAGATLQMASSLESPQFYDLAVLAILFTTASYGGRLLRWVGLGSAILGSVIATLYLVLFNGGRNLLGNVMSTPSMFSSSLLLFFGCLAALGLSWTLGLLARTVRRSRQSRAAQVEAEQDVIVEQERNRIARDMHDVVAHSLAVVIAQADGARYARESDPEAVDLALTTISTTAREALGDVRILLGQLRHSQSETPQPMLGDLDALVDQLRSSGLILSRESVGEERPLATAQQLAVYRITQEALTNALRHGDTEREVRLIFAWKADALRLVISSAVNAPRAGDEAHPGGHGLAGMRERTVLVGGVFSAGVDEGRWVVTATIPLSLEAVRL
ncbi:histidine kinase [Frigoribacterium sp. UYMn621]|uniref:sensor histidine kinase n=1 Tax=Frigoribacterium sp. UYMn621 TaxID=3156343 RepID=UPI00339225C6